MILEQHQTTLVGRLRHFSGILDSHPIQMSLAKEEATPWPASMLIHKNTKTPLKDIPMLLSTPLTKRDIEGTKQEKVWVCGTLKILEQQGERARQIPHAQWASKHIHMYHERKYFPRVHVG